ncbi:NTP pyrophosphohydrolase [Mycolicibacterium phlei]|uniref:ADP-ribose pyrophosphatase n=1 Tax=Mycolicibacterium phlei DSM 43239 = CCUG 21000 TaxID=1226750 RepID=A0A5N5UVZ7_MYCPH|nr:NUDIX hydrolase [Mycolicibacterium phlei]VEG09209.1 NTP pyrophosphohydrolase [Mycobacteroides chelonae]AMO61093.1 ADP-ribose pyrophosphatase [Mycolicibacterium phlei]EID08940.1 NTP pyrophosphohydrolase [Mycolicibacterium phlei RIVM601174]KAB7752649.1 ADP-ribose pyrophosphatase [Mycolicibacterium phlei DSM 43239 = CCUG 21000]KXW61002.1 ADP-ribose pyrophosphatase [Mycolicibacterium phlei DSM 43239 = CCUG 21000]
MAEHDFETVASETLYVGKIFALRADEVRMPGGNTARREVIEHYGAVAVLAMDDDRNIALVYQYRHPVGRRLWELPAGLLDLGGEPPHLTAARELEEEAGLAAADWRVLVDLISAPGFSDESVRVYLATGITDVGRPQATDEEADMVVRWFPLAEAVRMVYAGEIVNSLAVAGILAAHGLGETVALRPVEAPWPDRSTAFARRKGHP